MRRIYLFLFMLVSVPVFSQDRGDSLWSRNSIRIDVGGKALGGVGIVFERKLLKKHPDRRPQAFTSVEFGISDPLLLDLNIMPGLGASRNWYLFKHKRFVADAGIYMALKIDFEPTKKEIRESYKGWSGVPLYIRYPFVPYLFSDIGLKMMFEKWFIKLSLNPVIYYEQIYAHRLTVLPWGGISFGFKLKK